MSPWHGHHLESPALPIFDLFRMRETPVTVETGREQTVTRRTAELRGAPGSGMAAGASGRAH